MERIGVNKWEKKESNRIRRENAKREIRNAAAESKLLPPDSEHCG